MSDNIRIYIEIGDNLRGVLSDYVKKFQATYGSPKDIGSGIAEILAKIIENAKAKGKTWRLGNG